MHRSFFFKIFPPPKFLVMPYAGLDISDDAITAISLREGARGLSISRYATQAMPASLMQAGDIKDEKAFVALVSDFAKKNGITYARVSLPEEKMYLFETDVPNTDRLSLYQNIESKLEENVPLSPQDALFNFNLLPSLKGSFNPHASVSVAPRTYIDKYVSLLNQAGIIPLGFEGVPHALAAAIIPTGSTTTELIVHVTENKAGLYVVTSGVVAFTSTVAWGRAAIEAATPEVQSAIIRDIGRVYSFWSSKSSTQGMISRILVAGEVTASFETLLHAHAENDIPAATSANIWTNAFDVNHYVPPISQAESHSYGVAAGLALPW
jgi:Tfp pilus assembly PilM family ATPase